MSEFNDKVVLVTGAGEGIGRGIARRFAREGATVVVAEIDEKKGRSTVSELKESGARAHFIPTDVSKKDEVFGAVSASVETFGRLDVLVNNAVALPEDVLFEDKTDAMLEQQLGIGVWGSWWAMQAARPFMQEQGGGRIINFTSVDIETGAWLHSDYNVAKAGIQALTRSAAMEWARFGILVNCVMPIAASAAFERLCEARPGFREAANQGNPLGRMGDPENDIGPVVVFLASESASYVTGVTLPVDGGLHLPRGSNRPPDLSVYTK
jgi:3-oxoacyl-[acyl-carrier protein] reductase